MRTVVRKSCYPCRARQALQGLGNTNPKVCLRTRVLWKFGLNQRVSSMKIAEYLHDCGLYFQLKTANRSRVNTMKNLNTIKVEGIKDSSSESQKYPRRISPEMLDASERDIRLLNSALLLLRNNAPLTKDSDARLRSAMLHLSVCWGIPI